VQRLSNASAQLQLLTVFRKFEEANPLKLEVGVVLLEN
jgi:hypothetical protein